MKIVPFALGLKAATRKKPKLTLDTRLLFLLLWICLKKYFFPPVMAGKPAFSKRKDIFMLSNNNLNNPLSSVQSTVASSLKKNPNAWEKIKRTLLMLTVFLTPLFFFPPTSDMLDMPKKALVLLMAGALLLIYLLEMSIKQKLSFRLGKTGFLLVLFVAANLISLYLGPNSLQSFYQTGLFFLSLMLLYLAIINSHDKKMVQAISVSLVASVSLLALFSIYQYLGATEQLGEISLFGNKAFTPAGSQLILLSLLLLSLPLNIIMALKNKDPLFKVLLFLLSAFQLVSLVLVGAQALPGGDTPIRLLPLRAGWLIGIDAFKIQPLFGFGPDNFLSSFTLFRPVFLNQSETLWTWRFFSSSNLYLHLLATVGLSGFALFTLLVVNAYQNLRRHFSLKDSSKLITGVGIIMLLVLGLLVPYSTVLWTMLFVFMALLELLNPSQVKTYDFPKSQWIWVVKGVMVALLLLVVGAWFLTGRVMLADHYSKKGQDFLVQNKGKETYDYQLKAIQTNTRNVGYHIAFANTNFALANSLSTQANQQELTDQDKQQITNLVQQAIQEAKVAINLNQRNIYAWESLANLYRQLINFAEGADQWTIAAFKQAIALDPSNSRLRVDLGGVYFSLGDLESATDTFKRAIELKPGYANAYYNLAVAYREKEDYVRAYLALQQVLSLVPRDSEDYTKVSEEMVVLKEKIPTATSAAQLQQQQQQSQLTEPQALPTTPPQSQIKLPEDTGPEIPPTATPTPTETAEEPEASPSAEEEIGPEDQP